MPAMGVFVALAALTHTVEPEATTPASSTVVPAGPASRDAHGRRLGARPKCTYHPSMWEADWVANVRSRMSDEVDWKQGCAAMQAERRKVRRQLDWIATYSKSGGKTVENDSVMSGWQCGGGWFSGKAAGATSVPIEPLVGHLRHPMFHCVGRRRDTFELMFDTSYLVVPHAADLGVGEGSGVRKFFFDAGASVYGRCAMGCQRWFIDEYHRKGIDFDRIIGWEYAKQDHGEIWHGTQGYPSELHYKTTYHNTAVSADVSTGDNPLMHILALCREEDYVVFKLDIDNNPLEVELVKQLLASPKLLALVDEFFWEHHVHGSPLRQTRVNAFNATGIGWGKHTPPKSASKSGLDDSYALFTALRKHGIRAHSWI